jgi:hypothetical protein
MSTISLDISVPAAHATTTTSGPLDHAGFMTGLSHGWAALSGTVVVTLTAVGALLPFAVALALVGLPLWWVARRVWRGRPTPAAEAPTDD